MKTRSKKKTRWRWMTLKQFEKRVRFGARRDQLGGRDNKGLPVDESVEETEEEVELLTEDEVLDEEVEVTTLLDEEEVEETVLLVVLGLVLVLLVVDAKVAELEVAAALGLAGASSAAAAVVRQVPNKWHRNCRSCNRTGVGAAVGGGSRVRTGRVVREPATTSLVFATAAAATWRARAACATRSLDVTRIAPSRSPRRRRCGEAFVC